MNKTIPVEINNLSYEYKGHPVFDGLTLSVESGEFLSIIGPNGSGKTTLLKLISGLLFTAKGEISLFSERLNPANANRLRLRLGYVSQGSIRTHIPIQVIDTILMGGYGKRGCFRE